ncbi:MAG: hypothetical protein GTO67_12935, partial [Gammaproteobacteria bacterium]|nr:hypothetical protein [Gammaproteobacteria bacterium]NIT17207.1 hypothetical protein [Gammaproteobacteria bacterium]
MSEDRGSQFDGARRSYFVGVASFFLALVLIGFAPSFFLKFVFNYPGVVVETAEALRPDGTARDPAALTLPIHVVAHSLFSAAWIGLFLVQAFLIRSNRRGAHQTLGGLGLLVAAGASITGFVALFRFMPRLIELADPPDPAAVLAEHLPSAAGDFGSFLVFTVAVLIGALLRHRPEWHKQLMLLASMTLLSPPM